MRFFVGRLGLVGELAVGRGVEVNELAAELAQQRRGGDAAGAVDAVEHDLVSLGGDAQHVDVIEHALDVQRVRFAVLLRRDEVLDADEVGAPVVVKLLDRSRIRRRRGDAVAVEEFQAVPFDRIVRGGGDRCRRRR